MEWNAMDGTKVKYQSREVTIVRKAQSSDPGYDQAKGDQVLIKLADGSEKVVPKAEVTPAS